MLPPPCGLLRLVLDVLEQRERLAVQQQQELGQVGAPEGQAGLQQEHLEESGSSASIIQFNTSNCFCSFGSSFYFLPFTTGQAGVAMAIRAGTSPNLSSFPSFNWLISANQKSSEPLRSM